MRPLVARQQPVNNVSEELKTYEAWKAEGARIRSKVRWRISSDRGCRDFFRAVRPLAQQVSITELLNSSGVVVSKQQELEDACVDFYSKLYAKRTVSEQTNTGASEVLNAANTKITGSMSESLGRPITLEELTKAVPSLARQKSPGPDGIVAELFKTLWPTIRADYVS